MAKACVAIGISQTQNLPPLPGAVNGAKLIAEWATAAGYDTRLVIDRDEAGEPMPVTIEVVRNALMTVLPTANDEQDRGGPSDPPERLIVYFAGHGLQTMARDDLWLLSTSTADQIAIGITALQTALQQYLPGQITIISDACRTPAVQAWNTQINPVGVVPLGPYSPSDYDQIDIDRYIAVPSLTSAFMVRATADEPARCIFTSVLLEALHGISQDCFDNDQIDEVTSRSLASYLRKNVRKRGEQFLVDMRPQTYPCFLEPDVYVTRTQLAEMKLPKLAPWPKAAAARSQGPTSDDGIYKSFGKVAGVVRGEINADALPGVQGGGLFIGTSVEYETPSEGPLDAIRLTQFALESRRLDEQTSELRKEHIALSTALKRTERATHYETECGFTVAGQIAGLPKTAPTVAVRADPRFPGSYEIDFGVPVDTEAATSLLVPLPGGGAVASFAMSGFITDVVLQVHGATASNLRPMWLAPSKPLRSELVLTDFSLDVAEADTALDWAATLRTGAAFDPTLAILAAYLFHAAGWRDSVQRLATLFSARRLSLPFDIAMLAGAPVSREASGRHVVTVPEVKPRRPRSVQQRRLESELGPTNASVLPVAGSFPILRQGWLLLDAAPVGLEAAALAPIASQLLPAPFATLDSKGATLLSDFLETKR